MKRLILLLIVCVFFSGCAKLKYLKQLLTLKEMSEEGEAQTELVNSNNSLFDELKEAVESEEIKNFQTKEDIISRFGEPVYEGTQQSKPGLTFLSYRYSTLYLKSDKVYLYFDNENNLVDWDLSLLEGE